MNKETEKYSNELFEKLNSFIENSRKRFAVTANSELDYLYWITGKNINKFILHNTRATYRKQIIYAVNRQLTWTAFLLNQKDIKVAQFHAELPEKQ